MRQLQPSLAIRRRAKAQSVSRYWVVMARTGPGWLTSRRRRACGWAMSTAWTMSAVVWSWKMRVSRRKLAQWVKSRNCSR